MEQATIWKATEKPVLPHYCIFHQMSWIESDTPTFKLCLHITRFLSHVSSAHRSEFPRAGYRLALRSQRVKQSITETY